MNMHSQAIQLLFNEHEIILDGIENVQALLEEDPASKKDDLKWYVKFFREYGDQFHHQKEEGQFFQLLSEKNPMVQGIIQELEDHHEMFRDALKEIESALNDENWKGVKEGFDNYFRDLTDHIHAENDELFISAEELLDEKEKETLYFNFIDKDSELDEERKARFEERIRKV